MKAGPLCALLWRILTWCTRRQVTLKAQHIPDQLNVIVSRQTLQTRPDHSNRMVPSPRGLPNHMLPLAPAPSGPVCHQVQQQTATVCVTSSRPPGMGSGCTQSVLGRSGPICLSTSSHLGQSGGKVAGLPMQQNHTDCTGVAQHALVLGSGVHNVVRNPPVGGPSAKVLAGLALSRFKSKGSIHTEESLLPTFQSKTPPLTTSPLIVSGYANPTKNKHLKDALQVLIQKQAVEKVIILSSLAFYNRLFLVPTTSGGPF